MVDKAITVDNLRLLCPVVNVCSGTARRPWHKYCITARCKFCIADSQIQDLMHSICLAQAIVYFANSFATTGY